MVVLTANGGRCPLSLPWVCCLQRQLQDSWEVIQPAEEGKLDVSYRWFRTCKDAEGWWMRTCQSVGIDDSVKKLYQVSSIEKGAG